LFYYDDDDGDDDFQEDVLLKLTKLETLALKTYN
jgi:hypothetical protein